MAVQRNKPTAVVRVSKRSLKTAKTMDAATLSSIVQSILEDPTANADLSQVVLKGGRVRAALPGRAPGDVAWTKTVWRRSGPIRPGEQLVDPADLVLPLARKAATVKRTAKTATAKRTTKVTKATTASTTRAAATKATKAAKASRTAKATRRTR